MLPNSGLLCVMWLMRINLVVDIVSFKFRTLDQWVCIKIRYG